jgi:transcription antitermination factor NusG
VDQRDEQSWIIVELNRQGELKVEDGTLASTLRRDLSVDDDFPVFVPSITYKKAGRQITVHLMEGYCFVGNGLTDVEYYALERKNYVESVMSVRTGPHRMRTLSVVPNREVKRLQNQLQKQLAADILEGDWVKVVRGKLKGLEGRVLELPTDRHAYVHFALRSLHRVTPVPRVFLETIESA